MPAEFVNGTSGIKLVCNGFVYGRSSQFKNKTFWRCIRRFSNMEHCKAKATTVESKPGMAQLSALEHNHDSNVENYMKKLTKKKRNRKSSTSTGKKNNKKVSSTAVANELDTQDFFMHDDAEELDSFSLVNMIKLEAEPSTYVIDNTKQFE